MTAAVVAVSGGATAWAELSNSQQAKANTTIECGLDAYIPLESGNPIADCEQQLARQETNVPPLVGWIAPNGFVQVLPSGQSPDPGSTKLPDGFTASQSIIFVNDVLNDTAIAINATCATPASVKAYAQRELDLASLTNWSISVRSPSSSCSVWIGSTDAESMALRMDSVPGLSDPSNPLVKLDSVLRKQLGTGSGGSCLNASQAVTLATTDANQLGIASADFQISQAGTIGTAPKHCAEVTIDPGGGIEVVIWMIPESAEAGQ